MSGLVFYLLIFITGLLAGFINTLGGGGSAFIYPLLIFGGLSPHEAVGTARPAFLMQGLAGWWGFKSENIHVFPFNLYVSLSAAAGSVLGAMWSLAVPPLMFKKIIAVVIAFTTLYTLFRFKPASRAALFRPAGEKKMILNILVFFLLGIYSGFIQTGLGYLIIITLITLNGMNLTQANSVKALVIALSGIPSLYIFAHAGMVRWFEAGLLAAGMGLGSWVTSKWSVRAGEGVVKRVTALLAVLLALKLWWN